MVLDIQYEKERGNVPRMDVEFLAWNDDTKSHDKKDITLEGERFWHRDIFEIVHTQEETEAYKAFNGWVLLNRIGDIVLYFRPGCIVEIGAGESSGVLAWLADRHDVTLHSVDLKDYKGHRYNEHHIFYCMDVNDFMKDFNEIPSLVLIDGDHRYEQVKKEFEFFFNILTPGGAIFLHDTFPPHEEYLSEYGCGDVFKLRQELEQRTDEMDCITFPYTAKWMGLTIALKKDPLRPEWGR